MSAASYQKAWDQLPETLRVARAGAWKQFVAKGFPSKREEDWRYTDLSALNDARFAEATETSIVATTLQNWQSLVFANGQRQNGEVRAFETPLADDGITALNAALTRDGLDLRVARKQKAEPLHLLCLNSAAAMTHLRHRVVLEAGSEATLLIDTRGDDSATLATGVLEVEIGANARLRLLRIQDGGQASTDLFRSQIRVGRDARLEYVGLDLGGALVRHDLNVQLCEPGAYAEVHGVFAPGGSTHVDTHTRILHQAPHTTSREVFRGLVADRAHAVFNGRIVVEKAAQKTDSEQKLASLLLSPGAEINAKPELEIYADDVKCAHGATCGQLDEMALYYLRSRGLDSDTARNLLLFAFAHEVLAKVGAEDARREMERRLANRLPGSTAYEDLI
ncbi:MAG: Fe-S cluster assembly protein SufD [Hydrocarboniphaga sp.]|uniref:Fe-S cluster assembly protein SufD n=1 Tax=Hydrocarboniphaga sp. TaxID=2033016 RepID=UPI002610A387|nr:Fe-S cluster assembly protein SufD [Hydrocarboniphaga sp.]MDB5971825.1 Fe-S cluster assembly protein SufD [Hydrocarboniphaga sp.]